MAELGRSLCLALLGGCLFSSALADAREDAIPELAAARSLGAREQWAASESLATVVLDRLEHDPKADSLVIADALDILGTARWRRVGYADGSGLAAAARALGIRERRLAATDLRVAESHAHVARFLPEIGRPDSAIVHVKKALAIRSAQPAPDDTLLAQAWDQLALIQRNSGDMRGALESWTRAIELQTRARGEDDPETARLLAQTGVPWMELGDLDHARAVLEESLRRFARSSGPDEVDRWIPLNILADVERRSGNLSRDIDLLQEALRVVRLNYGDDSREALTLRMNLAIALHSIGDEYAARAMLLELLPATEAQYGPKHTRTLAVKHGLAVASLSTGENETALAILREEEQTLAAREGPPPVQLAIVRGQIADVLYRERRDIESLAAAALAVRTAEAVRNNQASALVNAYTARIATAFVLGDTAVLDSSRRALAETERRFGLKPAFLGPAIEFHLARAAQGLGELDEAWEHALEADQLSREALRVNLEALPDRSALQLTRGEGRYLELVVELARSTADAERRAAAWDRVVRTRGLVASEVALRRPPRGSQTDTVIAAAHERWRTAQRRWAQKIVSAGAAPRDSVARAALDGLRAEAEQSESAYARLLADRGAKAPAATIGLADARARLAPGQALLAFYEIRGTVGMRTLSDRDPFALVAFVARGGENAVEWIELGASDDLSAVLEPWRERLVTSPGPDARAGSGAERDCRSLGLAVRRATWDKLAPHLRGAQDVYVVADGPLLGFPWQALPAGSNRYLVEEGPRIHVLNAERELAEPRAFVVPNSMLALGAPDFERGSSNGDTSAQPAMIASIVRAAPDPCASGAPATFAPLPATGEEAAAVAATWRLDPNHRATVLLGADASELELKRAAHGNAILHLATHGIVASDRCAQPAPGTRGVGRLDPVVAPSPPSTTATPAAKTAGATSAAKAPVPPVKDSPWTPRRVWLALAGANRAAEHSSDDNEGLLTAEEVVTLDLEGTDWVVLSACHAGVAEAWAREGALGMRRAFALAGARTVIAGQWAVEDASALEWMKQLYAARAAGETSAAAAVETASRQVLAARRKAGRTTHPFYWAAFGASGE